MSYFSTHQQTLSLKLPVYKYKLYLYHHIKWQSCLFLSSANNTFIFLICQWLNNISYWQAGLTEWFSSPTFSYIRPLNEQGMLIFSNKIRHNNRNTPTLLLFWFSSTSSLLFTKAENERNYSKVLLFKCVWRESVNTYSRLVIPVLSKLCLYGK